jgi:HlyD family secretion protein
MQRFLKIPYLAVVAILAIGLGTWWWHARNDSTRSYRTAIVTRGEVAATIAASGTIEPVEVVDVGAQVAGLIKSFGKDVNGRSIDYGSVVDQGAVLANIDDSVYVADLSVARAGELSAAANLEQMNAKLDQAQAEWKRAQDLYANKLMAQVDYDTDKANYEVAKANVSVAKSDVAQAQAALEKAQRNLDFCVIKSPVKGVIIDRRVNIGQTVVASLNAPSLFLIAKDLSKLQIWVSVNEADVARIKPGSPVNFTCAAFPGRQFKGTVGKVRLNATMTQNIVIYTVEVNTDNSDNVLLPYLTANVNFVVREETNVLLVPNEALHWSPSTMAEIAPDTRSQMQTDPPRDTSGAQQSVSKDKGVVWVKDGEYVRLVEVTAGTTDGVNTAVAADNLPEGALVVTGSTSGHAEAAIKNPFVPQVFRR